MDFQTVNRQIQNFGNHFLPLDAQMQVLADRASNLPYYIAKETSTLWTMLNEHVPEIQERINIVKQHPFYDRATGLAGRAQNSMGKFLPNAPTISKVFKKLGLCTEKTTLDASLANCHAFLNLPVRFADKVIELQGFKKEANLEKLKTKTIELAKAELTKEGKLPQSSSKLAFQSALKTISLWGMRASFVYGSARVLQSVSGLFTSRIPLIGGLSTKLTSWSITAAAVGTFFSWIWAVYKKEPQNEVMNLIDSSSFFFTSKNLETIGDGLQTFAIAKDLLVSPDEQDNYESLSNATLQSQVMNLSAENFFDIPKKQKDE